MKLFVLCFFAAFYMMFAAACSGSRAYASSLPSRAEPTSVKSFGENLFVTSVQQFQDRQPVAREGGAPVGPRTITIVSFDAQACSEATDRDFSIQVSRKEGTALAKVVFPEANCSSPATRSFRVGTNSINPGEQVVVINPTVIEMLAATE